MSSSCILLLPPLAGSILASCQRLRKLLTHDRVQAVVLVNPGNPSGAVAEASLVRDLEQLCVAKGIYLISDEAYEDFVYDGAEHTTPTDENHVINIFTMSKSFSLAGWRVGYVVYPPELESAMLKVGQHNSSCSKADKPGCYPPGLSARLDETEFSVFPHCGARGPDQRYNTDPRVSLEPEDRRHSS